MIFSQSVSQSNNQWLITAAWVTKSTSRSAKGRKITGTEKFSAGAGTSRRITPKWHCQADPCGGGTVKVLATDSRQFERGYSKMAGGSRSECLYETLFTKTLW